MVSFESSPKFSSPSSKDLKRVRESSDKPVGESMEKKLRPTKRKGIRRFDVYRYGAVAHLELPKNERTPFSIRSVRDLLMFCTTPAGGFNVSFLKRLFTLPLKEDFSCVFLLVENVSVDDIEDNKDLFGPLMKSFKQGIEILGSESDNITLSENFGSFDRSYGNEKQLHLAFPSVKKFFDYGQHAISKVEFTFDTNCKILNQGCRKTHLLLSTSDLLFFNLPTPIDVEKHNYIYTKDEYKPVTDSSPMFAIDCEFCLVDSSDVKIVSRVAIVNEDCEPVYHSFVDNSQQPLFRQYEKRWKNLKVPGVLDKVQKDLTTIQKEICELLPPDAILVGHNLSVDLHSLKIVHPYIIDSSTIFNLEGPNTDMLSLQFCSAVFSDRIIQDASGVGNHDPTEDAAASLDLVFQKLKRGVGYGDTRFYDRKLYQAPDLQKLYKYSSLDDDLRKTRNTPIKSLSLAYNNLDSTDKRYPLLPRHLHINMMEHLQFNGRSFSFIIHPNYEADYRPKPMNFKPSETTEVHLEASLSKAMASARNHLKKDFVLVHTVLKEKGDRRHLIELEKGITELFSQIPDEKLMVLVFGGKGKQNGCVLGSFGRPLYFQKDKLKTNAPSQVNSH